MLKKFAFKAVAASLLVGLSGTAAALSDQWYVGAGGGLSILQPEASDSSIDVDNENGTVGTIYVGRDFDSRSSGQFQLYSLGEASFDDGQSTATYTAGDASLLYRFYDSRDRGPRGSVFGASFYGRFGFGFLNRDSDLPLDNDAPVYFGAGAGVETYFTNTLGVRLEALYHETDTTSATLTLVTRFGGHRRRAPAMPPPVAQTPTGFGTSPFQGPDTSSQPSGTIYPEVEIMGNVQEAEPVLNLPTTAPSADILPMPAADQRPTAAADSDDDGITDDKDQCDASTPGYPVTSRGCPLFAGLMPNLTFGDGSSEFDAGSYPVLDRLAQTLMDYPDTYIEVVAHTDNQGPEVELSALTRQRLRSIGLYLVQRGIAQERLLLRSFGGKRPAFDNNSADGRRRNNRIEIFENP